MPKYVVQRSFSVGEDRMPYIGWRSRQIIEEDFPDVTWLHSHVTVTEEGNVRTFCIYQAPNEDAIHRHSQVLGYHVVDAIFEIAGDVTPEDFPPVDEPV
jgi:Protein of unknown function (DUF4242)